MHDHFQEQDNKPVSPHDDDDDDKYNVNNEGDTGAHSQSGHSGIAQNVILRSSKN